MTEIRPWSGFEALVDSLVSLQKRARDAAARSVDEILTVRNWLIGIWIIAFGLGRSNLENYRQIALTWPRLGIRQTVSGEFALR